MTNSTAPQTPGKKALKPALLTEGYEQALRLIDEMFERGELSPLQARQAEAEAAKRFGVAS